MRTRADAEPSAALGHGSGVGCGFSASASRAIAAAASEGWRTSGGAVTEPVPSIQPPPGLILSEHAGQGMTAQWLGLGELRLGSAAFCGVDESAHSVIDSPRVYLMDSKGWMGCIHLG